MPDATTPATANQPANATQPADNHPTIQQQYDSMSPAGKFLLGGILALGAVYMLTAASRHIPFNFRNPNSLLERIVSTEKAPAKEAPKLRSNGVYSVDKDYKINFCDGEVWPCENNDEDIAKEFARQSDSIISCFPPTGTNQDFARQLRAIYGPEVIKKGRLSRTDVGLSPTKPIGKIQYRVKN
jgi:hypothetical protein